MSRADAPQLSAIVVSFNGAAPLERCLRSLVVDTEIPTEVLAVVRDRGGEAMPRCGDAAGRAAVEWIRAPADTTIPQMRRIGLAAARGDIVALLEDDCVVDPLWASALVHSHAARHVAVGGAVEPGGYRRALDWAAYFCDYARFMLPFDGGETCVLPGNNVSYKRAIMGELMTITAGTGLQEAFVHETLRRAGHPMKCDPAVVVRNEHEWSVDAVSLVPYHHGRAFAGQRAAGWRWQRRLLFALASLLLPVLQVGRILDRVVSRRRHIGSLARAFPWIVLFGLCWSAGECVGYASGPGESLRRWQ